jgi:UPF0716 protein FxsA
MRVFPVLMALFLLVPLVEIYLLIKIGGEIGAWPTVALVVATAVIGAALLRWQGIATLLRVRQSLDRGELPALAMLEGVLLLIAGALLLTPGFFTDTVGFLLLVPPLRRKLLSALLSAGMVHVTGAPQPPPGGTRPSRTLEGEFRREDD